MKLNLPRNTNLLSLSKELRKNAAKQENHLWYDFLKEYSIQFYRQYVIGDYIADFYCKKAKLIIEIDGSQHCEDNALNYDEKRTKFFKDLGLNIVRFFNNDLDNNFEGVCIMIENEVKKLIRR
jgi:very-short-patch-repair endonuclease